MVKIGSDTLRVPLLGHGRHDNPRNGLGLLELVSVLTDSGWTDRPTSVHPALAVVAETVNDLIGPNASRALVPLAPWLCTAQPARFDLTPAVVLTCANTALPYAAGRTRARMLEAIQSAGERLVVSGQPSRRRPAVLSGWLRNHQAREAAGLLRRAIGAVAAAVPPGPERDLVLVTLLEDCINASRAALGADPVHPWLPLEHCPGHIDLRVNWTYHPATGERTRSYQPADPSWVHRLVRASVLESGRGQRPAAQARRTVIRYRPARRSGPLPRPRRRSPHER
ncbi:MAG TPA: hypothetical protein VHV82_10760 [Sporichthyaceae bacterium]|jgi:hypothetical protein|nr:hypothetical protein [Sporichthyaceae bacterium]